MNQSEREEDASISFMCGKMGVSKLQFYVWLTEKVAGDFETNKRLKQSKGKANTILVLTLDRKLL